MSYKVREGQNLLQGERRAAEFEVVMRWLFIELAAKVVVKLHHPERAPEVRTIAS